MSSDKKNTNVFKYRTVLGAWINDISSKPRVEQWPSIVLDKSLERDYSQFFDMMKDSGYNSIVMFGLFAAMNWKPRFQDTITPERERAVRRILAEAQMKGIKVLYGLGLYSWGFDEVIKSNPDVQGTNPHAMCGSKEASHKVMEDLIKYLAIEFPFDGFHFESADLGRCSCKKCAVKSNSLYHLELNERMAKYVRANWRDMIIEVYSPINVSTRKDWTLWQKRSKYFTFIIDDVSRINRFGCNSRKDFISKLGCAYGTRGGTWLYPPQRWNRLRWFVPILEKRADHYRKLADDGGRAIMIQGAPLINPSCEAMLRFNGKMALNPYADIKKVLVEVVEEMFRPRSRAAAQELADIFWNAEKAFWSAINFPPEGTELQLESLLGKVPGPPVYLQTRMYWHTITEYRLAITDIKKRFNKIKPDLSDKSKCRNMTICLNSVLRDIDQTIADKNLPKYPVSAISPVSWTEDSLW